MEEDIITPFSLGRWITPDPQGFQDSPNLYAYVHNSPLTHYDLYGLFSWSNVWNATISFGRGLRNYAWDIGYGTARSLSRADSWIGADAQ